MKYVALSGFFFIAGLCVGTLQQIANQPRPPVFYAEPSAVFTHAGRRCVAWAGEYRGAAMYSVHCDDGTMLFTRNYLYF